MDVGLRTPLLDFFRRGDAARDVRLLAAQGAIAPRPVEQLGAADAPARPTITMPKCAPPRKQTLKRILPPCGRR
jgi:hypothetical protein